MANIASTVPTLTRSKSAAVNTLLSDLNTFSRFASVPTFAKAKAILDASVLGILLSGAKDDHAAMAKRAVSEANAALTASK